MIYNHFKLESLDQLRYILKPNDWMTKLDLKDAYHTIPINERHRRYLRFQWKGKFFEFTCLPFGLSSAPFVFTKLLKPFVAFFRSKGHRHLVYLDDILLIAESSSNLLVFTQELINMLESLGSPINWKKAILAGTIINSFSLQEQSTATYRLMPS